MLDLNGKVLLITGGTGLLGQSIVNTLLQRFLKIKKIIIFSRDEYKQYAFVQKLTAAEQKKLKFVLGDIRNRQALEDALRGVDVVIHAAALKQVPTGEFHITEFTATNITGSDNLIKAAIAQNVSLVVGLSTDKAVEPLGVYGATKLCMERLFVQAHQDQDNKSPVIAVVRLGNIIGSRGSVVPAFLKAKKEGNVIPIMHPDTTRFNITQEEATDFILKVLEISEGGEIFIPKMPSFSITELAEALAPSCKRKIMGLRPGEKIHETLISETEASRTVEHDQYYVVFPSGFSAFNTLQIGSRVAQDFVYNSANNQQWLNSTELRTLVKKHVDTSFEI